jgi:hypothetical protein
LLAGDTGAGAVRISDGGVTAPAFFDRKPPPPHHQRAKHSATPLQPGLIRRPVTALYIRYRLNLVVQISSA